MSTKYNETTSHARQRELVGREQGPAAGQTEREELPDNARRTKETISRGEFEDEVSVPVCNGLGPRSYG